ncbi:hypothetical protein SAMN05444280_104112 [Tangfeifania diversioriginum]|uniref:Uncharacterized protein n=1 Tax=Tangfeifania diversioriginum TaxID=1168035 RepID=A0A1M6CW81_9BACT|nr:hypothetical protein SAMN05444280_104112 [Tangfeifania diversioriginum]
MAASGSLKCCQMADYKTERAVNRREASVTAHLLSARLHVAFYSEYFLKIVVAM